MIVKRLTTKGQSILEYTLIITIVLGAFLGIQNYFKRGLQGRWKTAVDDLGDQYDPIIANTRVRHLIDSTTRTIINTVPVAGGQQQTTRVDITNSTETKTGFISIIN